MVLSFTLWDLSVSYNVMSSPMTFGHFQLLEASLVWCEQWSPLSQFSPGREEGGMA
jgi:hypothetical protein